MALHQGLYRCRLETWKKCRLVRRLTLVFSKQYWKTRSTIAAFLLALLFLLGHLLGNLGYEVNGGKQVAGYFFFSPYMNWLPVDISSNLPIAWNMAAPSYTVSGVSGFILDNRSLNKIWNIWNFNWPNSGRGGKYQMNHRPTWVKIRKWSQWWMRTIVGLPTIGLWSRPCHKH